MTLSFDQLQVSKVRIKNTGLLLALHHLNIKIIDQWLKDENSGRKSSGIQRMSP